MNFPSKINHSVSRDRYSL